jgi:type III restriction enzyme
MFETIIPKLKEKYTDIKLIRNKRALPIFDFKQGRRFEPDFILLLKDKNDNGLNYQFFIEPKGSHIQKFDQWKEDFLLQIKKLFQDTLIEYDIDGKYRLIGLSFYSKQNKQKFKRELIDALSDSQRNEK